MPLLSWRSGGVNGELAQYRSQDNVHLHIGEGGTHAPTGAAAERDPGERGRLVADEALRVEAFRVRVDAGILVDLTDADHDRDSPGYHPVAETVDGWIDAARGEVDHRPRSLGLQNCRLTQFLPVPVGLLDQRRQQFGVSADSLERPAQRGRGGLVAGGHQREQLVTNL